MQRYTTECIVLKRINYHDSDKLYTLLSKDKGKISALGKGVRKISSRRGGNLDTLNRIQASLSESTHGFKTISEVKTLSSYSDIKRNLELSKVAYYILEVLNRSLEDDHVTPGLYELVVSTLNGLNKKDIKSETLVSRFEILFLKETGYEISLGACVNCGRTYDGTWPKIGFSYELGGFFCDNCMISGELLNKEEADVLSKLAQNKYNSQYETYDLTRVYRLTRKFILSVLGQRLKSLEF